MRILHIIYDDIRNPWCGGGGAYRVSQVNENIIHENQVIVLTGNFPRAKDEKINGVSYKRVGLKSSYLLSRISFTLFIPFFMRKYKSDIVINDCSFFAPCFADLYTKRPVVNVIHHLMGKHAFKIYFILGFFPFIFENIFLRIARNIITSAKGIKEEIQKRYHGKNVSNIANGVSDELFLLKPEDENFVLFLGRIDVYMKGLDKLLEAFSKVQNRHMALKIAGSGKRSDEKKLVQLIKDLKLEERVEFLGKVSEKDKFELLRTCLFLVMPSRFEGWGITAVEANAAGKPVLGTKIKGLAEAVVHERTALLVETEDVEGLRDGLDLFYEDSALRARFGQEGRRWAKRFSWESIFSEQFAFYRKVIEG